jgi:hypothetical protein
VWLITRIIGWNEDEWLALAGRVGFATGGLAGRFSRPLCADAKEDGDLGMEAGIECIVPIRLSFRHSSHGAWMEDSGRHKLEEVLRRNSASA